MLSVDDFMPSEGRCAQTLRELRWRGGVLCPFCGSRRVTKQGRHLGVYQRYVCKACGSWFNDKTGTLFFNSKLSLRRWFFAALLMDLNAPTTRISEVLRVTYKTALRITKGLRRSIYIEDVVERLKGVVEVDETYLKAGLKGRQDLRRPPRSRALRRRGRGTYRGDKPPIMAMVQRRPRRLLLEPTLDMDSKRLLRRLARRVVWGSTLYTDGFKAYQPLEGGYIHGWVEHGVEWGRDGVHTNTAEGEFSVFKPWMATYRGVCKRYLYLYCNHYQFTRNHQNLGTIGRLHKTIKKIDSQPDHQGITHHKTTATCYT